MIRFPGYFHLFPLVISLFALFLSACQHPPRGEAPLLLAAFPQQVSGLSFDTMAFEHRSEPCRLPEGPCARVTVRYPVARRGPSRTVAFVNDTLAQYVALTIGVFSTHPARIPPDIDSLSRRFIAEYEAFRADNISYARPWTIETKGRVLFQNEKYLSVELENFSYTGGAHPNSFRIYLTFDLDRRRILGLEDLVTDEDGFAELVKTAFRTYHQLGPEESLVQAGFFWDETFVLPENVALTPGGLRLVYNPYEVAPYAVGATVLDLSRDDLRGLVAGGLW